MFDKTLCLVGVLASLTAAGGCATTQSEGAAEPESPARVAAAKPDKNAAKVLKQATFDLQCETESASIQLVSDDGMMGKTYGARGCGRQATYKVTCGAMGIGGCFVFNEAQSRMAK